MIMLTQSLNEHCRPFTLTQFWSDFSQAFLRVETCCAAVYKLTPIITAAVMPPTMGPAARFYNSAQIYHQSDKIWRVCFLFVYW